MENPPSPVQNVPEAHSASSIMQTELFLRVNVPDRGFDYPPNLASRLKKK
jgi:hypothetical protein